MRMCVGFDGDGCGREEGAGRERTLTRRKKMMFRTITIVTSRATRTWLAVKKEVVAESGLSVPDEGPASGDPSI